MRRRHSDTCPVMGKDQNPSLEGTSSHRKPTVVTFWYGPRACRSCLSRQPYARKHVANHQGQSAGRHAAGFRCPTARPGA